MNAKELSHLIGKKAIYPVMIGKNLVRVEMTITDTRHIFDRVEVKVVPVSGAGFGWANINNIKIEGK